MNYGFLIYNKIKIELILKCLYFSKNWICGHVILYCWCVLYYKLLS